MTVVSILRITAFSEACGETVERDDQREDEIDPRWTPCVKNRDLIRQNAFEPRRMHTPRMI